MKRKKKPAEHGVSEKWAVPYADFLSLLLALFIALYAISAQNKAKVEALKKEFIKIFDFPKTSEPVPPNSEDASSEGRESKGQGSLNSASPITLNGVPQSSQMMQDGAVLEQINQGVTLQLPSSLTFSQGSADIDNREMYDYVRDIASIIKRLPPQVKINVRGYTDDVMLSKDSKYANNFSLASARAFNVMQLLIDSGVDPKKVSFTSFGPNDPIAPNTTAENRIKNNRVEIFLTTDSKALKETKTILDKVTNR